MMDDMLLMELVKDRPMIYDPCHRHYMDSGMKIATWKEIGEKMNTDGERCKQRWNNMRDNYKKSLKKVRPHRSLKHYRYARQLSFLKKHMREKELVGDQSVLNMSTFKYKLSKDEECQSQIQPEDIDEEETSHEDNNSISAPAAQSETERKRKFAGESASSVLMKYLLEKKSAEVSAGQPIVNIEHPVDAFLFSLSSSLKSLPPHLLMSAKSEIFACVEKYERKRERNSSEPIGNADIEGPHEVEEVTIIEESEEQNRIRLPTGDWPIFLSSPIATEPSLKKLKPSDPNENDLLKLASELLYSCCKQPDETNDEFKWLAKLWTLKLRALVPAQKRLAERAINEILFEADSGTLHRNSVRFNHFSDASVTTSHPSDLSSIGSSSSVGLQPPDIGQASNALSFTAFDSSFTKTEPECSLS